MNRQAEQLADLLLGSIEQNASRLAIVHGDARWTYAELGAQVERVRQAMAQCGLRRGERVVLWLENSPRFVAAWIAILALGGVAVPLHVQTPVEEIVRLLRKLSASGLVVSGVTGRSATRLTARHDGIAHARSQAASADAAATLESIGVPLRFIARPDGIDHLRFPGEVDSASEDLAQIIYTSGSTAAPKGVMLSHRNLIANARAVHASLGLSCDDSVMAVLPFAFSYGNSVLLTHLLAGACVIIENTPYPQAIIERMRAQQATTLAGVTSTFAMLLRHSAGEPLATPALRTITHAGSALPTALLAHMRIAFARQRIFLMYGQTEAAPRLTCLPFEDLDRKPGSVGPAIDGVSLRIVREDGRPAASGESGEVLASGENIMQGYWGDPESTATVLRDGWLRTGDLGHLDADGYLTLSGRRDELIKSGDHRIGPAEIEAVLLEHPQVREAAVVGIDDALLGQALCALVVLAAEAEVGERDLLIHCARRLAPYKRPRAIRVVGNLARTPSGKLLRKSARDLASALIEPATEMPK